MGSHNGTYVPWHEPFWSHAKVKRAAAVVLAEAKARVPEECAPSLIGRWLHALSCWALRDGDTGCTGRLTDAELAQVAWPEGVARGRLKPAAIGSMVRSALRAGGLLVGDGEAESIHDFGDHNRRVLADRGYRRGRRSGGGAATDCRTTSGSAIVRQSYDCQPTDVRQEGDESAERRRLARASGSEAERLRGVEAFGGGTREPGNRPGGDAERGYAPTAAAPPVEPKPPSPQAPGAGRSRPDRLPDEPKNATENTPTAQGRDGRHRQGAGTQLIDCTTHDDESRLSVDPGEPTTDEKEAHSRAAHRLELAIGCGFVPALKAVQGLVVAGADLAWIEARIARSTGTTQTPWAWVAAAKQAWADHQERVGAGA